MAKQKGVNPNKIYESVSMAGIQKNWFDKSHQVAMTGNMGELMPCMCIPVRPGDNIRVEHDMVVRMPALVAPAFAGFKAYIHTFYVSNRVVWQGFDEFFAGKDGYEVPNLTISDLKIGDKTRFWDFFGISPIEAGQNPLKVNPLAFAAYTKIYNDYYRPRPFENEIDCQIPLTGGAISSTLENNICRVRRRSWMHDYFTSMLPEPMVAPDVTLSVADVALKDNWFSVHDARPWFVDDNKTAAPDGKFIINNDSTYVAQPAISISPLAPPAPTTRMAYDPNGSLEVVNTSINELRLAYARQRYLEKMGRVGGEYYEIIQALYNWRISDARLQRAEYITGMQAPVVINPVLSTADTADSPIGQQAGHAVSIGYGGGKTYHVEEHGHIISIMSMIPDPVYKTGVPRHFRSFTREDYVIPDLANIGEQPVYSWELVPYVETEDAITTLGYMPNYTDQKQMLSRIQGLFRDELQQYVVVKEFAGVPGLDKDFVQVPPDIADHIFVVDSAITDNLWINIYHTVAHETCLPVYSDPI